MKKLVFYYALAMLVYAAWLITCIKDQTSPAPGANGEYSVFTLNDLIKPLAAKADIQISLKLKQTG